MDSCVFFLANQFQNVMLMLTHVLLGSPFGHRLYLYRQVPGVSGGVRYRGRENDLGNARNEPEGAAWRAAGTAAWNAATAWR